MSTKTRYLTADDLKRLTPAKSSELRVAALQRSYLHGADIFLRRHNYVLCIQGPDATVRYFVPIDTRAQHSIASQHLEEYLLPGSKVTFRRAARIHSQDHIDGLIHSLSEQDQITAHLHAGLMICLRGAWSVESVAHRSEPWRAATNALPPARIVSIGLTPQRAVRGARWLAEHEYLSAMRALCDIDGYPFRKTSDLEDLHDKISRTIPRHNVYGCPRCGAKSAPYMPKNPTLLKSMSTYLLYARGPKTSSGERTYTDVRLETDNGAVMQLYLREHPKEKVIICTACKAEDMCADEFDTQLNMSYDPMFPFYTKHDPEDPYYDGL